MTAVSTPLGSTRLVLADRVFPRTWVLDIVLVVAGAALVAILAQVSIPLEPVPITGQTLGVLLVGASLGWARGGASLLLYAALGLVGMPVFAPEDDGSHISGLAALASPSFGYIVGFIPSAVFVGWLAGLEWDRKVGKVALTFLGGSIIVFAFGLPWLAISTGADLATTLEWGLYPFIVGGIVKALIAAELLPLAWLGANRLAVRRESAEPTESN